MQAKDIPDELFLEVVRYTDPNRGWMNLAGWTPGERPPSGDDPWRSRSDVQRNLEFVLGYPVPEKVFLAKARALGKRRLLEGCTDCSCVGRYHLPSECPGPELCGA